MKRNTLIIVDYPRSPYHGRLGKVVEKRDNQKKGVRYHTVYLYSCKSVTPLPETKLIPCKVKTSSVARLKPEVYNRLVMTNLQGEGQMQRRLWSASIHNYPGERVFYIRGVDGSIASWGLLNEVWNSKPESEYELSLFTRLKYRNKGLASLVAQTVDKHCKKEGIKATVEIEIGENDIILDKIIKKTSRIEGTTI